MASYTTYTAPGAGVHPRLLVANASLGTTPTVATVQGYLTGKNASWWAKVVTGSNTAVVESDLTYFDSRDNYRVERTLSLCARYLLDPTLTPTQAAVFARKAIDVAEYIRALSISSNSDAKRGRALIMAFVYDWCYAYMTSTERLVIRRRIVDYANVLDNVNSEEYCFGHSFASAFNGLLAYAAVLNDGAGESSPYDNSSMTTAFETLLDHFDDGTDVGFWPIRRHFGDDDGGSLSGMGAQSYFTNGVRHYLHVFPALKTAIDLDLWTDEGFVKKIHHWVLWHLRNDNSWFNQHDTNQQAPHRQEVASWMYYAANQLGGSSDEAKACQYIANYIQDQSTSGWRLQDHDFVQPVIHGDASIGTTYDPNDEAGGSTPAPPTIAGYGGGDMMRVFTNAGKICIRDSWLKTGWAMTWHIPKYFIGGHQHRDAGHWCLSFNRQLMTEAHGHYQSEAYYGTYKGRIMTPTGPGNDGHQFNYYRRLIAKNGVRIIDPGEETDSVASQREAFWYYRCTDPVDSLPHQDAFAYELSVDNWSYDNCGDQLHAKRGTSAGDYIAHSLVDIVGDSKIDAFDYESFGFTPVETSAYCYAVADLKKCYYTAKRTRYKRHFLLVKAGQISGWAYPVLIIWDDIVLPDPTPNGKNTATLQIQHFTGADATSLGGNAWEMRGVDHDGDSVNELVVKLLSPASYDVTHVDGYETPDGIEYTTTGTKEYADDGTDFSKAPAHRKPHDKYAQRIDINPGSDVTDVDFLHVYLFQPIDAATVPTMTLVEDGSWMGVQFNGGLIAKIAKGDTHSVSLSSDEPPSQVTGFTYTDIQQTTISLDWDNHPDEGGDFDYFSIRRQTYDDETETWGTASEVHTTTPDDPTDSSWTDTGLSADTTYRYGIRARDSGGQYSTVEVFTQARTLAVPPVSGTGVGVSPWRPGRRYSKYWLGLE